MWIGSCPLIWGAWDLDGLVVSNTYWMGWRRRVLPVDHAGTAVTSGWRAHSKRLGGSLLLCRHKSAMLLLTHNSRLIYYHRHKHYLPRKKIRKLQIFGQLSRVNTTPDSSLAINSQRITSKSLQPHASLA